MPPVTSSYRVIYDFWVEQLKLISKANGYFNDVKQVTKRWIEIGEIPPTDFPMISLIPGVEVKKYTDVTETLYEAGAMFSAVCHFTVDQDTSNQGLLTNAAEQISTDVQRMLLASLSALYALYATSGPTQMQILEVYPAFDWKENRGTIVVSFMVKYHHDGGL